MELIKGKGTIRIKEFCLRICVLKQIENAAFHKQHLSNYIQVKLVTFQSIHLFHSAERKKKTFCKGILSIHLFSSISTSAHVGSGPLFWWVVLTWGWFCPQGILGTIWRHFGLSKWGVERSSEWELKAREAAEPPAINGTIPSPSNNDNSSNSNNSNSNNNLAHNMNSASVEKPWFREKKAKTKTNAGYALKP